MEASVLPVIMMMFTSTLMAPAQVAKLILIQKSWSMDIVGDRIAIPFQFSVFTQSSPSVVMIAMEIMTATVIHAMLALIRLISGIIKVPALIFLLLFSTERSILLFKKLER